MGPARNIERVFLSENVVIGQGVIISTKRGEI